MIENLNIRQAEEKDIEFLVEAIIESEKSGTDVISTCNVFGISEARFREILREALMENIPDYDYFLSGFFIAEKDGEYVGSIGSWIEAAGGTASGMIKTSMMVPYLDTARLKEMSENACLVKSLSINREPGALQLEYDYTRTIFRRQGVFSMLLAEAVKRNKEMHNELEKVQVGLFKSNFKSLNVHLKLGFDVVEERHVDDEGIFRFFPYNTKVLLEAKIDNIKGVTSI